MKSFPKILIVDDEPGMQFFLKEALEKEGYPCDIAGDGKEALKKLERGHFQIVLMDIKMPKMTGLKALTEIKRRDPDLLVILMTAYGSKTVALEAIGKGAYDYFTKPFDLEEMRVVLKRATERCRLQKHLKTLRQQVEVLSPSLIGQSRQFRRVLELVDKVATNDITVLITGESGTGKELVARAIHDRSERRWGPFVPVHCAAIPETLIEVELFGHEKGAFTGADQARPGKFEIARGGTIFLDEIGELETAIQSKILRVLQEREVHRIGGPEPVKVDVRFIAATNRDLNQAVSEGSFREDLFFRLNVFHIDIPPLRERAEDIPLLINHFFQHYARQLKREAIRPTSGALDRLVHHSWPGNIRELENVVQRALVLAHGEELDEKLLTEIMLDDPMHPAHAPDRAVKDALGEASAGAEKRLIKVTLRQEQGRRQETALRLGISRKSLYNKMRRYGLL
jgi:DNA-binding NtrC family response regulator